MRYKKISKEIVKEVKSLTKKNAIPLHEPTIKLDDIKSVKNCLKSSFVSSVSQYTNIFENKIVVYIFKDLTRIKLLYYIWLILTI